PVHPHRTWGCASALPSIAGRCSTSSTATATALGSVPTRRGRGSRSPPVRHESGSVGQPPPTGRGFRGVRCGAPSDEFDEVDGGHGNGCTDGRACHFLHFVHARVVVVRGVRGRPTRPARQSVRATDERSTNARLHGHIPEGRVVC